MYFLNLNVRGHRAHILLAQLGIWITRGPIKEFVDLFGRALLHHLEEWMKEVGSPKLLFENLDLTPPHPILWTDLHEEGPGRPVEYQPECDLRALMLRQLLQIPYVKDLVKRLRRTSYLRRVCGYRARTPCQMRASRGLVCAS
jgi:hypothetical protein